MDAAADADADTDQEMTNVEDLQSQFATTIEPHQMSYDDNEML